MDLERALQAEVTADAVLKTQLAPGEQVLWWGEPLKDVLWPEKSTLFAQMAGAILWVLGFLAFGQARKLPLLLLYLLFFVFLRPISEPLTDAFQRKRTAYAVTDRRVLIVRGGLWRHKIQSLPLKEIAGIHLTESAGGRGTIHLGLDREWRPNGELRLLERPEEVSDLIRRAQLAVRFPETLGSSATQVSPAL